MSRSLLQFLKETRQIHLRYISGSLQSVNAPIYVVGNPSADLDSIVSAIVYSYFAHLRVPASPPRSHIPLLNLPTIPSGSELCRLRPEFVKALQLSVPEEKWADTAEADSAGEVLREHVLTVNDFANHLKEHGGNKHYSADMTMVDWNALPIRTGRGTGSLTGIEDMTFSVVGYIDHHADEDFVPDSETLNSNQPRIIKPAGSCASLVVSWLQSQGFWHIDPIHGAQVARLALTPILIDTVNLTAESKVTESDREAIEFLNSKIGSSNGTSDNTRPPHTQTFLYTQVHETKQNSLDLLTVDEILDRDFKSWTETSRTGEKLQIGFCSVVKPISWVIRKAGSHRAFLDELCSFSGSRKLDVVVVMTAFNTGQGFCRELCISALRGGIAVEILETFVLRADSELGLKDWSPDEDGKQMDWKAIQKALNNEVGHWKRLWIQGDVSKSRKQVAPLLRDAAARL